LEILFANQKKYDLALPAKDESGEPANVAFLVRYLCDKVMKDPRKELFVLDDTVYVPDPREQWHADISSDGLEYWSSSTKQTGSLKAKTSTRFREAITSCSYLRYTGDS